MRDRQRLRAPGPPDYHLAWAELQALDWVRALEHCPQDPIHHAEGNVWIHTHMVLETLCAMPAWRALPDDERDIVYLAALLHDVAKPVTTRVEDDGRVTARGHSRRGEVMARRILWELGVPFRTREAVCGLIRYHQIPFYLIERDDAQRLSAEISVVTRADWLALVAEADIRGRVCRDMGKILDHVELFREHCREEQCYSSPRPFPSDHTRYVYFHSDGRSPDVPVWDDTRLEVVLMSGLPGSGKSRYRAQLFGDRPVVSMDALRSELDVDPEDDQGRVVQAAKERAREHLRSGTPFVWDATALSRRFRTPLLSFFAGYGARLRIVYVEAPAERLFAQNTSRAAVVPEHAIRAMIERWEVPDATEAHVVEHHAN